MVDKVFSGFCDQHFTGNKHSRPRQLVQACAPSTLDEETGSLHDTLSPKNEVLIVGLALHGLQILIWKGWRLPVTLGTV